MSVLDELTQLISDAEKAQARENQMLEMFRLAGYELDIPEDENGKSCPKDLMELLKEALGNPPTEPGQWIRIKDIPRYISDHLDVPKDLNRWNDLISTITVTNSTDKLKNKSMSLPRGTQYDSTVYESASEVPRGKSVQASDGQIWMKVDENSWTMHGDSDAGGWYDIDAGQFLPLKGVSGISSGSRNNDSDPESGRRRVL